MPKLAEACVESGSGLGFLVECPPERLLIAPLYFGGAIRIVVFGASISFGILGVCSFAVFPSGYENTTAPLSSKSRC